MGNEKGSGKGLTRMTCEVPDDLHRRVKIRAAEEGRAIRELLIEGLEMRLAEKKPKKGGGR